MAFVIKKKESFTWPVKIKSPKDGGGYEEQKINLEFKKLPQSEFQKTLKTAGITDVQFCQQVIIGWKDVVNENNEPVVFSEANLADFLETLGVPSQIVQQFTEIVSGASGKN
ncbi:MAG: phage tail assembly chaperone [Pseudobdellovibrionaceae bacterium]